MFVIILSPYRIYIGDCCNLNASFVLCEECLCYETNCTVVPLLWLGDGLCDDLANNEICNFDYGDCCGEIEVGICNVCQCLDSSYEGMSY